jgi:hypothetical protein
MKAAQKAVLQEPSTLQVVKNTVSTITGREGFEEEKSSVDFDNELLPRDFLKVQCKLNGSGLQYVRVRGVLLKEVMYDDKPGLMDVQKARRRYWVSRTQYAITTFIHRSALKSHKNCVTSTGSRRPSITVYVLEPRKTRWLAASVLASSTGGSDHDRDGIHRGSYGQYVFAASMLPYIYILYEIRGIKSCSTERVSKMRAVFTSSPSVGRCIPSRLHARHSEISTVLHRGFLQQGDLSPYKINLSLNAGVAVESNHVGRTYNLCKYATLGQDTRRALGNGFYSTFNGIFPIVTPGEIDKTCTRAICTPNV